MPMNDFLRRLTILGLIPRQPDWSQPASHQAEQRQTSASASRMSLSSGKVSALVLHQQISAQGFRGNLRAVQRDLVYLQTLFPDLCNDAARAGGQGWFWRGDAPIMDLPALDPALALAFVLARDLLRPLLPPILLNRLGPHFKAADRVLAEAGTPGLAAWKDRVRVIPQGQPLIPARVDPRVMEVVQMALLEGKRFRGRYMGRDRDGAEYEFNPLGLVYRERVIYLVATLWNYTDPRQFALHRFEQAEPMDRASTPPQGFDFGSYIDSGAFQYVDPEAAPIELRLRMTVEAAAHLHETPLSLDQGITDDDDAAGWVRVSARLLETEQLYWWLLGFGAQVEVLQPQSLRERMVENLRLWVNVYGIG